MDSRERLLFAPSASPHAHHGEVVEEEAPRRHDDDTRHHADGDGEGTDTTTLTPTRPHTDEGLLLSPPQTSAKSPSDQRRVPNTDTVVVDTRIFFAPRVKPQPFRGPPVPSFGPHKARVRTLRDGTNIVVRSVAEVRAKAERIEGIRSGGGSKKARRSSGGGGAEFAGTHNNSSGLLTRRGDGAGGNDNDGGDDSDDADGSSLTSSSGEDNGGAVGCPFSFGSGQQNGSVGGGGGGADGDDDSTVHLYSAEGKRVSFDEKLVNLFVPNVSGLQQPRSLVTSSTPANTAKLPPNGASSAPLPKRPAAAVKTNLPPSSVLKSKGKFAASDARSLWELLLNSENAVQQAKVMGQLRSSKSPILNNDTIPISGGYAAESVCGAEASSFSAEPTSVVAGGGQQQQPSATHSTTAIAISLTTKTLNMRSLVHAPNPALSTGASNSGASGSGGGNGGGGTAAAASSHWNVLTAVALPFQPKLLALRRLDLLGEQSHQNPSENPLAGGNGGGGGGGLSAAGGKLPPLSSPSGNRKRTTASAAAPTVEFSTRYFTAPVPVRCPTSYQKRLLRYEILKLQMLNGIHEDGILVDDNGGYRVTVPLVPHFQLLQLQKKADRQRKVREEIEASLEEAKELSRRAALGEVSPAKVSQALATLIPANPKPKAFAQPHGGGGKDRRLAAPMRYEFNRNANNKKRNGSVSKTSTSATNDDNDVGGGKTTTTTTTVASSSAATKATVHTAGVPTSPKAQAMASFKASHDKVTVLPPISSPLAASNSNGNHNSPSAILDAKRSERTAALLSTVPAKAIIASKAVVMDISAQTAPPIIFANTANTSNVGGGGSPKGSSASRQSSSGHFDHYQSYDEAVVPWSVAKLRNFMDVLSSAEVVAEIRSLFHNLTAKGPITPIVYAAFSKAFFMSVYVHLNPSEICDLVLLDMPLDFLGGQRMFDVVSLTDVSPKPPPLLHIDPAPSPADGGRGVGATAKGGPFHKGPYPTVAPPAVGVGASQSGNPAAAGAPKTVVDARAATAAAAPTGSHLLAAPHQGAGGGGSGRGGAGGLPPAPSITSYIDTQQHRLHSPNAGSHVAALMMMNGTMRGGGVEGSVRSADFASFLDYISSRPGTIDKYNSTMMMSGPHTNHVSDANAHHDGAAASNLSGVGGDVIFTNVTHDALQAYLQSMAAAATTTVSSNGGADDAAGTANARLLAMLGTIEHARIGGGNGGLPSVPILGGGGAPSQLLGAGNGRAAVGGGGRPPHLRRNVPTTTIVGPSPMPGNRHQHQAHGPMGGLFDDDGTSTENNGELHLAMPARRMRKFSDDAASNVSELSSVMSPQSVGGLQMRPGTTEGGGGLHPPQPLQTTSLALSELVRMGSEAYLWSLNRGGAAGAGAGAAPSSTDGGGGGGEGGGSAYSSYRQAPPPLKARQPLIMLHRHHSHRSSQPQPSSDSTSPSGGEGTPVGGSRPPTVTFPSNPTTAENENLLLGDGGGGGLIPFSIGLTSPSRPSKPPPQQTGGTGGSGGTRPQTSGSDAPSDATSGPHSLPALRLESPIRRESGPFLPHLDGSRSPQSPVLPMGNQQQQQQLPFSSDASLSPPAAFYPQQYSSSFERPTAVGRSGNATSHSAGAAVIDNLRPAVGNPYQQQHTSQHRTSLPGGGGAQQQRRQSLQAQAQQQQQQQQQHRQSAPPAVVSMGASITGANSSASTTAGLPKAATEAKGFDAAMHLLRAADSHPMSFTDFLHWLQVLTLTWCEKGTVAEALLFLKELRRFWEPLVDVLDVAYFPTMLTKKRDFLFAVQQAQAEEEQLPPGPARRGCVPVGYSHDWFSLQIPILSDFSISSDKVLLETASKAIGAALSIRADAAVAKAAATAATAGGTRGIIGGSGALNTSLGGAGGGGGSSAPHEAQQLPAPLSLHPSHRRLCGQIGGWEVHERPYSNNPLIALLDPNRTMVPKSVLRRSKRALRKQQQQQLSLQQQQQQQHMMSKSGIVGGVGTSSPRASEQRRSLTPRAAAMALAAAAANGGAEADEQQRRRSLSHGNTSMSSPSGSPRLDTVTPRSHRSPRATSISHNNGGSVTGGASSARKKRTVSPSSVVKAPKVVPKPIDARRLGDADEEAMFEGEEEEEEGVVAVAAVIGSVTGDREEAEQLLPNQEALTTGMEVGGRGEDRSFLSVDSLDHVPAAAEEAANVAAATTAIEQQHLHMSPLASSVPKRSALLGRGEGVGYSSLGIEVAPAGSSNYRRAIVEEITAAMASQQQQAHYTAAHASAVNPSPTTGGAKNTVTATVAASSVSQTVGRGIDPPEVRHFVPLSSSLSPLRGVGGGRAPPVKRNLLSPLYNPNAPMR